MAYRIKKLVDEGFDFNSLFPERVEEAKQSTLLNFTIQEIVDFIKVQTQDFTQDFPLAQDLDKAIYRVYEKKMSLEPEVEEPKAPTERERPSKESLLKQIKGLTYLAEKKNSEAARKQIKAYQYLLKKHY